MTRVSLWVLLILFALVWFVNLGSRALAEPDEGRYAEIPREMLVSGDWITPRLNGFKYFEKPALQYWATALGYKVFGVNEAMSRWYGTTLAFLTVPLMCWLGRRVYGEPTGVLAALLLAGSLMWAALGHVNTLDIALGFWLSLALAAFLAAQHDATVSRRGSARGWMWLAWLAIAAATLQKGLVAIALPGAAMVAYAAIQRDARLFARLYLFDGLIIVLAIAGPWFWLVSQRNPEFANFFFIHEHFTRFLTTVHRRDEPWWYFLPWLLLGLLPWIVPVSRGVVSAWREPTQPNAFHSGRFLVIWPAVTVLFFSASGSKLAPYIVPMFPPLALLAGRWLAEQPTDRLRRDVLPVAITAAALLTGAGAWLWLANRPQWDSYRHAAPFLLLAGGVTLMGCGLASWRTNAQDRTGAVAVGGVAIVAFASLVAVQLLLGAFGSPGIQRSSYHYAQIIQRRSQPGDALFFVGGYWQSLPFYLGRTGQLAAFEGELQFGIEREPALYLPDVAAFAQAWRSSPRAVAVVNPQLFQDVQRSGIAMQILFRDEGAVIIAAP